MSSCLKGNSFFYVREATRNDVPAIAKLIRGLAEFLGEPDKLKVGEEELLRDGFGDNPLFHCLVAEETRNTAEGATREKTRRRSSASMEQQILGFSLFYYTYSTWEGPVLYLEDLFVLPLARGQGIGTALMRGLAKIASDRRCARMQWIAPQGKKAMRFYERLGARLMPRWSTFRLTSAVIEELAKSA